jgi:hypothetical protein
VRASCVAHAESFDQIALVFCFWLFQDLMSDDTPTSNQARVRRQPPVPLTLALFLASVVGFMAVVTGLFALVRYLGGWR